MVGLVFFFSIEGANMKCIVFSLRTRFAVSEAR